MEIGVLGSVELSHAGRRLRLPGRQHRIVLGLLALQANELVSYDRLADLLWGDRPPQRPRAVLQTRVSELRAVLAEVPDGALRLLTRDDGYVLEVARELVDSYRFMAVSRDWRRMGEEEARWSLRSVLGLWRGPVLGGGLTDEAYRSLCLNLELARLTATEDLYDLELQAGGHAQVVDEIVGLAATNPTRERLLVQAMRALQRTGRVAEAFQTYDRARRWLSEELGIDPGGEAQKVYLALLRDEPAVAEADAGGRVEAPYALDQRPAAPAPASDQRPGAGSPAEVETEFEAEVPRILPPDIPDFTGREVEIARLTSLLTPQESGVADRPPMPHSPQAMIAVTGRGGVGKTALAIHVAHQLVPEYPDGQLYLNLRGFDLATPVEPADALGRFLRALGVDGAAVPERVEERADLYRQLLADRRVLVLLDNVADDNQVAPLIPAGQACGVIITSRARVGTELGAEVVVLDPLDSADAGALLTRIVGTDRATAEPDATSELSRLCGHLPLAIRVVAGRLATKPHWSAEKIAGKLRDERRRLDELSHGSLDVRASIMLSYQGLTEDAKQLLGRLGDLDLPEVSVWIAAALLDVPTAHAEEVLEQLLDSQLIDIAGHELSGAPRHRLHDLVRLFARERAHVDVGAAARAGARRRVFVTLLTTLEAIVRHWPGLEDYRVAHHGDNGSPMARDFLDAVLRNPLRWFEYERPVVAAIVRRACEDEVGELGWMVASAASPLFRAGRYFDDWQRALEPALVHARESGDQVGVSEILRRRAFLLADRRAFDEALASYQEAMQVATLTGDRHGAAVAAAGIAMVERFREHLPEALTWYEQALPVLSELGDDRGTAFVLRGVGQVYLEQGWYQDADTHLERSRQLYEREGNLLGEAAAAFWQGMLRLRQRQPDEATMLFERVLSVTRELGEVAGQSQALRGLGLAYRDLGRVEEARRTLLSAHALVAGVGVSLLGEYIRRDLDDLDRRAERGSGRSAAVE